MKGLVRFPIEKEVASRINSQIAINLEGEMLTEFSIWTKFQNYRISANF